MDPSVLIFDFHKTLPKCSQGHKKYTFGTFWQNKPLYHCEKLTQFAWQEKFDKTVLKILFIKIIISLDITDKSKI